MTRLALCVVVWSPCVMLFADEPKKPPPALEGAWQEPARPGEDPSLRYKITFADDKVTIRYREQVLTGTVESNSDPEQIRFTMTITTVEGNGPHVKGAYTGVYEATKDRVSFHFDPRPGHVGEVRLREEGGELRIVIVPDTSRDRPLGLAPVTLTLHKVAQ
jgi:hypothetical protein